MKVLFSAGPYYYVVLEDLTRDFWRNILGKRRYAKGSERQRMRKDLKPNIERWRERVGVGSCRNRRVLLAEQESSEGL